MSERPRGADGGSGRFWVRAFKYSLVASFGVIVMLAPVAPGFAAGDRTLSESRIPNFGLAVHLIPDIVTNRSGPGRFDVSRDGQVVGFDSTREDLGPVFSSKGDIWVIRDGKLRHPYARSEIAVDGVEYFAAFAAVSGSGRYVAFVSDSPGLVPGVSDGQPHLYRTDLRTGSHRVVDVTASGTLADLGMTEGLPWDVVSDFSISDNGRYVAFANYSSNLVPNDSNNEQDVFVKDMASGMVDRISVSSSGRQGGASTTGQDVTISGDGRFVAFPSYGRNLVLDDTNRIEDCFVHDRQTGATERINVSDDGGQMAMNPVYRLNTSCSTESMSSDGRFVTFNADGVGIGGVSEDHDRDVFLRDRLTGKTVLVSQKNGVPAGTDYTYTSENSRLTPNGKYIAFTTRSAVLLPPEARTRVLWGMLYSVSDGVITPLPESSAGVALAGPRSSVFYLKKDELNVTNLNTITKRPITWVRSGPNAASRAATTSMSPTKSVSVAERIKAKERADREASGARG